jgi:hypothetical protein
MKRRLTQVALEGGHKGGTSAAERGAAARTLRMRSRFPLPADGRRETPPVTLLAAPHKPPECFEPLASR